MNDEIGILTGYLRDKNLRATRQREIILRAFLTVEKHVSAEQLYDIVKRRNPGIGQASVFRTLKLFCDAGIARQVILADKTATYEHKYNHEHHDHLVCVKCGKVIEAADDAIEKMQSKLCTRLGFHPMRHRMEIFGLCHSCRKGRG